MEVSKSTQRYQNHAASGPDESYFISTNYHPHSSPVAVTRTRSSFWATFVLVVLGAVALGHLFSRLRAIEVTLSSITRDGIGMRDFAWRYNGAQIVPSLTTQPQFVHTKTNPPFTAIDDDLRPGRCWPFSGQTGQLGIRFANPVQVSHVTVDHIAKEVAMHVQNAPKDIVVWGYVNAQAIVDPTTTPRQPPLADPTFRYFILAEIRYDIDSTNNIQTFPIFNISASDIGPSLAFEGVVMEVLHNWGWTSTCIYRVRVHGISRPI